jgi:hypothetical protein
MATDQLVAGELERRLRQFDKALIRFASLSTYKEAQAGVFQRIVALQLKLKHERNAEPKKIQ